jgi:hypothetical protein
MNNLQSISNIERYHQVVFDHYRYLVHVILVALVAVLVQVHLLDAMMELAHHPIRHTPQVRTGTYIHTYSHCMMLKETTRH